MIGRLARPLLTRQPVYPLLLRRALAGRPLTILCYHTISADAGGPEAWTSLRAADFLAQVDLLEQHYRIVSLDEALASPGQDRPLAVLTFDDGDIGLYRHLLPLLQVRAVPVTIYIATGQIESGTTYWFDRVANACSGTTRLEFDLTGFGLGQPVIAGTGEPRWLLQSALHDALKRLDPAQREAAADAIAAQAPAPTTETLGPMTVDQLCELAAVPHITIGAHSHCHNLLDQLTLDQARDSVARSRSLLEQWTGQPIRHFAYPNGNHNPALAAMMRELGFASATILDNRLARPGADPFTLSRIAVGRYDGLDRLKLRLAGL